MTLKKKLTLGLGFLFLIIFVLVFFCSYTVGRLSHDAENILKDNYQSLVLSKNMIAALEDMRTAVSNIVFNPTDEKPASDYYVKVFEGAKTDFEKNLKLENSNITEIHEKEYVAAVNDDYARYIALCARLIRGEGGRALYFNEYHPAFDRLRHAVNDINDVNMQAVERKSLATRHDSARVVRLMTGIGIFCLMLALGYFWYFPAYVSNSLAYLSARMKALLDKSHIALNVRTSDEASIVLEGINLLENKLDAAGPKEAGGTGD